MELQRRSEAIVAHMKEIRILIRNIDETMPSLFTNNEWSRLWSSLDVIEDCQLALDYFRETDFPDIRGAYLYIYGFLQAMFLQQDATDSLSEIVKLNESIRCNKSIYLKEIRDVRNDVSGHPTNRKGISFIRLVRTSISKNSFSYAITGNIMQTREIDINNLIFDQECCIEYIISHIRDKLRIILSQNRFDSISE